MMVRRLTPAFRPNAVGVLKPRRERSSRRLFAAEIAGLTTRKCHDGVFVRTLTLRAPGLTGVASPSTRTRAALGRPRSRSVTDADARRLAVLKHLVAGVRSSALPSARNADDGASAVDATHEARCEVLGCRRPKRLAPVTGQQGVDSFDQPRFPQCEFRPLRGEDFTIRCTFQNARPAALHETRLTVFDDASVDGARENMGDRTGGARSGRRRRRFSSWGNEMGKDDGRRPE
jgi:hypothetical protein